MISTRPKLLKNWGGRWESNPQRPEPQSGALPVELLPPYLGDYNNWGCQLSDVAWGLEILKKSRQDMDREENQFSASTHAHVLETHGAQTHRIKQVLGVHDYGPLQQVLDFIEIEGAKLRPPGPND